MKIKYKCRLIKGTSEDLSYCKTYDVEFAGRVWWTTNDNGEKICGATEIWEIIE